MRRGPSAAVAVIASVALALVAAGCARPTNPWVYAPPPAVSVNAYARPAHAGRTVIAVAQFANPDVPQLPWDDVGTEMTGALRRALFNESDFEVRIAPELESLVSDPNYLLSAPDPSAAPVEVDFVLTGKVTDFHHTAALPKDVSRWGMFTRRSEAVVAFEWKVIDVRRRRVVAADHTYGAAKAARRPPMEEQYAGLGVSAYLFWNTPLGRAAHDAVENTITRMRTLLPAQMGEPVIVEVYPGRKVGVSGGYAWGLAKGQEYYVAVPGAPPGGSPAPGVPGAVHAVFDLDTGRPLMAKIGDVKASQSVAWLLGKPPQGVDLRGAFLSKQEPPPSPQDAAARQALAGGPAPGP